LFLTFEGQFLGIFLAQKIDKLFRKSKFSVKNLLILAILMGYFLQFLGEKSRFVDFFKVD